MRPTTDPTYMNEGDYRHWEDFLKEESEKYFWTRVSAGVYRRRGVMLKIVKRQGKGFQVVSFMEHPKWGEKTLPLVRDYINRKELIEILKNPRVHTDKGFVPGSPKRRLDSLFNQIHQNARMSNNGPIFHDTIPITQRSQTKSTIHMGEVIKVNSLVEAEAHFDEADESANPIVCVKTVEQECKTLEDAKAFYEDAAAPDESEGAK